MSQKPKLLILGTHEFAEEVADIASVAGDYELAGFVENQDKNRCTLQIANLPVLWVEELARLAATHQFVCGIGSTKRAAFTPQVEAFGLQPAILRHPTAQIAPTARVGAGSILNAGVIIGAQTTLGKHVIANRGVLLGHHTTIGNHVTLSPGANIAGRNSIGDQTSFVMGAMVINDLTVGSYSVVGAGSVVTKNVGDRVMVLGYPASVAKEGIDGI